MFFPKLLTATYTLALAAFAQTPRHAVRFGIQTAQDAVGWISAAALSRDGGVAATVGTDHRLVIWYTDSGRAVRRFETEYDTHAVTALSPDGGFVIVGGMKPSALLADTRTGATRRLEIDAPYSKAVAFSPDGQNVLAATPAGVFVWDVSTATLIRKLPGTALDAAFRETGRIRILRADGTLVDATLDGTLTPGKKVERGNEGISACLSPDGRFVLAAPVSLQGIEPGGNIQPSAGPVTLYDADSGGILRQLPLRGRLMAMAVAPGGRFAAISDSALGTLGPAKLTLWDLRNDSQAELEGDGVGVAQAFSRDGRLMIAGRGNLAQVWDPDTRAQRRGLSSAARFVTALAMGVNQLRQTQFAVTGFQAGGAAVWNLAEGKPVYFVPPDPLTRSQLLAADARARRLTAAAVARSTTGSDSPEMTDRVLGLMERIYSAPFVESAAFSRRGDYAFIGGFLPKLLNMETWEIEFLSREPGGIVSAAFSPDDRVLATGGAETLRLWDMATRREIRRIPHQGFVDKLAFSPDGREVATVTVPNDRLRVFDAATGRLLIDPRVRPESNPDPQAVFAVAFDPKGDMVRVTMTDDSTRVFSVATGAEIKPAPPLPPSAVNDEFRLSAKQDGQTKLTDQTGKELATLVCFGDGGWAVVDPEGRYDASDPDDTQNVFWTIDGEPFGLSQFKNGFYVPNLLNRIIRRETLNPVPSLAAIALPPAVEARGMDQATRRLDVALRGRDGGIGRLLVRVNGRELEGVARGGLAQAGAREAAIPVDLSGVPGSPDGRNRVELCAYGLDGIVASRMVEVTYATPVNRAAPRLFALISGISQYADSTMALTAPDHDAAEFEKALRLGASRMLGAENVHIQLLTTGVGGGKPTKAALSAALREISERAEVQDLVVIYLAGHGKADGQRYYYLTRDARQSDMATPANSPSVALSSAELAEWAGPLKPRKVVIIVDTCDAASLVGTKLTQTLSRSISGRQREALERLKDTSGAHILMASNAESLEAPRYGRGLLNMALLEAMYITPPQHNGQVDVGALFTYAQERVPLLARTLGRSQQPQVSAPKGSSFPLGVLEPADLEAIRPRGRWRILTARTAREDHTDPLRLDREVNERLRKAATTGDFDYIDATDVVGTPTPWVTYREANGRIVGQITLTRDGDLLASAPLDLPSGPAEALAPKIASAIVELLMRSSSRQAQ